MLLVLVTDRAALPLGADSARRLARLGVTRVAVLQDRIGLAVALEGWAFDPARSGHLAAAVLAQDAGEARTLHQVAEVAVAAASDGQTSPGEWGASPTSESEPSRKGGSP
jgi:hypothetical protein